MKYQCLNCGKEFDHPEIVITMQTNIFGIPQLNDPKTNLYVCPLCGSENVKENKNNG